MNKTLFLLICFIPLWAAAEFLPVQNDERYQVQVDLTRIVDGKVRVEVVVPVLSDSIAVYNMPVMVPGTYKIYNFGRFVNDLVATGGRGDTLETRKLNDNQWQISNARDLYKIEYWVNSTFEGKGGQVFAPAGTKISEEVFLLNNFGFVGYMDGLRDLKFEYHIRKSKAYAGTSSLPSLSVSDSLDIYLAADYFELHDCPILYASPDTVSTEVAGAKISVGVYSPEGNLNAREIMEGIEPVFFAAADYLGGDLPRRKIYGDRIWNDHERSHAGCRSTRASYFNGCYPTGYQ